MRFFAAAALAVLLSSSSASALVWPSGIERVARDIESKETSIRRKAARDLIDLPPASIRRIAPGALDDPDPDVRVAALEALLEARAKGIAERVAPWLGDADARVRRAAAEALARQAHPPSVPALGRILSDPDTGVRVAAARALGASGLPAAVVSLLGRLDDPDPDVRAAVARALARIGDPSAVVPLVGKVQDNRPNVRQAVAEALGALGDARASSALALVLRDSDEMVRVTALAALGRLRATDAVPTIASLLEDERRVGVREAALSALADIPSDLALDALFRALEDDDPREVSPVRAALVRAGARAVPKLEACFLGQPSSNVADGCALALGEMRADVTVRAVGDALRQGVVTPLSALRALGASGDPRGLAVVLEFLSSEDPWFRRAAIEAADALLDPRTPDGRAVGPIKIARALDAARARRTDRAALVTLLGKTGSPRAASDLVPIADRATDPLLKLAAVRALGWLGRAGHDDVLLRALGDERPSIRLAAAVSLRQVASARVAGELMDRLERAADQDRAALAIALAGALGATSDKRTLERALGLALRTDGGERDALVEAIGAAPGALGSSALTRLLARGMDPPTRAKVAEALAGHAEAIEVLRRLAGDPDAQVRANAVWALGAVGGAGEVAGLVAHLGDDDVTVAANAAAALGRLGARRADVVRALCGALSEARSAVRASAARALAVAGQRCPEHPESALLADDPSEQVRAALARLLRTVPALGSGGDARVLARCAAEDPAGPVALLCSTPLPRVRTGTAAVSVYVVPSGAAAPVPRAPFALVRPDGLVRYGWADRRGSVFEHDAPRGPLRLDVPAPLTE